MSGISKTMPDLKTSGTAVFKRSDIRFKVNWRRRKDPGEHRKIEADLFIIGHDPDGSEPIF